MTIDKKAILACGNCGREFHPISGRVNSSKYCSRICASKHIGPVPTSLESKFFKHTDIRESAECWPWEGPRSPNGYGQVSCAGDKRSAHRLSYEIFNGPIPAGMVVRHVCDNPSCVNPEHLLLGSKADNSRDMMMRGRGQAKMTEAQAVEIKGSSLSVGALSERYGVSVTAIRDIKNGKTWAWLAAPVARSKNGWIPISRRMTPIDGLSALIHAAANW